MARFVSSFSGVLIILIMVLVGYVLTKKGWFDEKAPNLIAKLVTQVALPCYMISTIVGRFIPKKCLIDRKSHKNRIRIKKHRNK